MSNHQQSRIPSALKPARLAASATLALPRWGLILLCLLYILPGLFGRDPWKNIDAAHFGVMWTMAQGTLHDWFYPNVAGLPISGSGPLTFWLGALGIKLFGGIIGAVSAARIATLGFFLLAAYSVWHTAFLLGRRPEAQPMRLAFGGQPEPDDYGRVLADGALLIYLGCLGILMYSHETSVNALYVSLIAFTLYRSACYVDRPGSRNAVLLGIALGCLALTYSWITPAALYLGFILISGFFPFTRKRLIIDLLITLCVALALVFAWLAITQWIQPYDGQIISTWVQWNLTQTGIPSLESGNFFFRYAIWGFWPAWPFAFWAIYAWHRQWRTPHVLLPLLFTAVFFILAILSLQKEETFMLAMFPPLSILAAFGLPTIKRATINAIDWFSVITFTIIATIVWLFWIAAQTGWPYGMAKNAMKLAPGFIPEFHPFSFIVAIAATISWFVLVYWRVSRRPSVLWRAVVLSSGGVILCWLLLATLWLPWINYNKSYAGVARQITQYLPDENICVNTNTGPAQRASFAYFGHIQFAGFNHTDCKYALIQDSVPKRSRAVSPEKVKQQPPLSSEYVDGMKLIWEGHRPSDREERFRLYEYQPDK